MRKLLQKVLQVSQNKHQAKFYPGDMPTIMDWHNCAGNHYFDDHPSKYDITESEGHHIRAFFQTNSYRDPEHIEELSKWGVINED